MDRHKQFLQAAAGSVSMVEAQKGICATAQTKMGIMQVQLVVVEEVVVVELQRLVEMVRQGLR